MLNKSLHLVILPLILFFAPLGASIKYYTSITVSPHLVLTLIGASIAIFGVKRLSRPPLMIFVYALFVIYLGIVNGYIHFQIMREGFGLDETLRRLLLVGPAVCVFFGSRLEQETRYLARGYVAGVTISAVIAFQLYLSGEFFWGGRLSTSPVQNPGIFGAFIASGLLVLFFSPRHYFGARLVVVGLGAFLVMTLIMSQARNSTAAFLLALVCAGAVSASLSLRNFFWGAVALFSIVTLVGIAVSLQLIPEDYYARYVVTLETANFDEATGGRGRAWTQYLNFDPSLFGYGFNRSLYGSIAGTLPVSLNPHNAYIDAYVSGGVVGLLVLLGLKGRLLLQSWQIKSRFKALALALVIFFCGIAFGNDTIMNAVFWVPFVIWCSIVRHDMRNTAKQTESAEYT